MINPQNTLVTTQWLLPLFNEQFEHLHRSWRQSLKQQDLLKFTHIYHNFAGSLKVANLPVFAQLAKTIEVFLEAMRVEQIDTAHSHTLLFASELLLHELNNYVKTGQYQAQLLQKRSAYLQQILRKEDIDLTTINIDNTLDKHDIAALLDDTFEVKDLDSTDDINNAQVQYEDGNLINYIQAPTPKSVRRLNEQQFNNLSSVWRHSIRHLLLVNENDTEKLQKLVKAARYLMVDAAAHHLPLNQGLWYLTGLWLTSLTQTKTPKPVIYAHVLADLDHAIMRMADERSQLALVKALLADVYIQLNGLNSQLDEAQVVLERIHNGIHDNKAFFPRLLERLETLIFELDKPQSIIKPLQNIKSQLGCRGWHLYEQQVEQILRDLYEVQRSPELFEEIRWQIERQLQELYGAMYTSSQTIDTQIGAGQLVYQEAASSTLGVDDEVGIDQAAIRRVRIAVEDIKAAFSKYLKKHSLNSLPEASKFETLRQAFLGMGLHDVVEVTEQCQQIFTEIQAYELTQLTWALTDTIAQGLATFELFLDYMAQQTLDLKLLSQSREKFASARSELLLLSQNPEMVEEVDKETDSPVEDDVLRYDDDGEVNNTSLDTVHTDIDIDLVAVSTLADGSLVDGSSEIFTEKTIEEVEAKSTDEFETESVADNSDSSGSDDDADTVDSKDRVEESGDSPNSEHTIEESPELIAAKEVLKDDNFDMDDEIKEIFIEEADEVLNNLEEYLPVWQADPMNLTPLAEIRRGFHTLKGSGRMVGAFNAGELAWAVENLLNRVLDNTLPVTDELIQFIRDTKALIPVLVTDFAAQKPPSINPAYTVLKANNLIKGQPINQGMPTDLGTAQTLTSDSIADEATSGSTDAIVQTEQTHSGDEYGSSELDDDDNEISSTNEILKSTQNSASDDDKIISDNDSMSDDEGATQSEASVASEDAAPDLVSMSGIPEVLVPFIEAVNLPADDDDADEDIKEIFIEEAGEVLEEITPIFAQWRTDPQDKKLLGEVRRGFHTLKGSGRMVGAFYSGEMAWAIEDMLNRILDNTIESSSDIQTLIGDVLEAYPNIVTTFENGGADYPELMTFWAATANAYSKKLGSEFAYDEVKKSFQSSELASTSNILKKDTTQDVTHNETSSDGVPESSTVHLSAVEAQGSDTQLSVSRSTSSSTAIVGSESTEHRLDDNIDFNIDDEFESSDDHSESPLIEVHPDNVLDSLQLANDRMAEADLPAPSASEEDQEFYSIFLEEVVELVDNVKHFIEENEGKPEVVVNDDVVRAFHTLRGAAGSNSLKVISEVSATVEHSLKLLQQHEEPMTPSHLSALTQSIVLIEQYIEEFKNDNVPDDNVNENDKVSDSDSSVELQQSSATVETNLPNKSIINDKQDDSRLKQDVSQVTDQGVGQDKNQYITQSTHVEESEAHDTKLSQQDSSGQQSVTALQQMFDDSIDKQKLTGIELNIADIINDDIDDLLDADWELQTRLTVSDDTKISLYAEVIVAQIEKLVGRVSTSTKFVSILSSLHSVYRKIEQDKNLARQPDVIDALKAGHKQLIGLFDSVAGSMSLRLDDEVINQLNTIAMPTSINVMLKPQASDEGEDSNQENINQEDTNQKAAQQDNTQQPEDTKQINIKTLGAESLDIESIDTDIELLEIFLEEAQEIDAGIQKVFDQWNKAPENVQVLKVLQRHLHTIKGGARMAGIASIGDLTHEAETIYELFVNEKIIPTDKWVKVMQSVQDVLSQQIDYVVNNHQSFFATELVEQLKELATKGELSDSVQLTIPFLVQKVEEDSVNEGDSDDTVAENTSVAEATSLAHLQYTKLLTSSWNGELPDKDILEVFLEEAEDIIESSNEYLKAFRSNTSDLSVLQKLQRNLHTIKGGARMVHANGVADLSHEMETVYEDLASRRRPATKMVGQLIEASHDWLASAINILEHQINPPTPVKLIDALKSFSKDPDSLEEIPVESLQFYQNAIEEHEAFHKSQNGHRDIDKVPSMTGNFQTTQEQSAFTSEMIRISAGLMERMINLSGESAINRARIDMEITSLTNTIEEMGVTVQRLADQLRRMDVELEAQVLAQIDDEELLGKADFDPLEMDQYSSLNQLSKSLSESASDLLDIKTTMLDKTRDAEGLLLQLSRTQAELQDGLMDSRMVPFSRLTPRLQRIVRQTANELNKQVELKIINADDEMDRTILERITSPLEHMLRNAVDHGIETVEEREAMGKPKVGRIVLEVLREGSEVVIHLSDDGGGINVEAVRKKAISQGLIDPNDTSLTDLDVMQYIFNAGLTTTNKVTQISGRGVGMDVVLSQIRQLGGIVSVESKEGGGSKFSMRVPLTVAVSDALVVRVGDHYYAVPLVQIERVVRVNPERLYHFYQLDKPTFEIDGMDYRLRYLNEILNGTDLNELSVNTNLSLPVIIVKNQTGQQLALQVDEVAGSRIEVVVKPLGRQLSHASGISAATIMADGSVMLILDLMALLRNAPARLQQAKQSEQSSDKKALAHRRPSILVIDDSVTVRKVTSRLLERQGFETHVAKDGIDAIEVLQELTPDLMLLDIEMPRMDGFEVATQVRHDPRLKDIPIIMITSRTGDKHRERALEIGVDDYMGKPYQEAQLINTVQGLLGQDVHD